jgi:hypothetical protein
MRTVLLACLALSASFGCHRREPSRVPLAAAPTERFQELAPGLHLVDLPGSKAKATVVELTDGLALLEAPLSDHGATEATLVDHRVDGERLVRALAMRFPGKPLRLVLSSHWHPHSLSAIEPFVKAGATIVTTPDNLAKLREMGPLDPRSVRLVTEDHLALGDASQPIVAHRFTRARYPSVPTTDYLLFELRRYGIVHVGCLYTRWAGPPVLGRELVTARAEDLDRLLRDLGVESASLLRVVDEPPGTDPRWPRAGLAELVRTGVTSREIGERYRALPVATLRSERDRLVREAVRDGIPGSIFNGLAYEAMAAGDLPRARELATLQVLLVPGDANAWDSLGEITHAAGDPDVAARYGRHSRTLDPALGPVPWGQARQPGP